MKKSSAKQAPVMSATTDTTYNLAATLEQYEVREISLAKAAQLLRKADRARNRELDALDNDSQSSFPDSHQVKGNAETDRERIAA